ncbi:MAG: hypothetical protein ISS31_04500 [Kiritimatiellae bacterium]|nr:hypothetical protein [Kiritimatiellia bacterium]
MAVKYGDLELAYDFVSSGPYGDHSALLNRSTGQIYWASESGDLDEISEEMWESDDAVEIPRKDDLDLGSRLVFRFVDSHVPDDYGRVRDMFSSRGAYARYKQFLASKGLLEKWYAYEAEAQERALRDWAGENGIELT